MRATARGLPSTTGKTSRRAPDDRLGAHADGIEPIPDASVQDLANATQLPGLNLVRNAPFEEVPPAAEDVGPHGVSTEPALGFPHRGDAVTALTNGQAGPLHHADATSNAHLQGDHLRGESDLDVTVLRTELAAPEGADGLGIDYRFLTNERPGSRFQDAFLLEEAGDGTSYTDEDLPLPSQEAGAVYCYTVTAVNAGGEGEHSDPAASAAGRAGGARRARVSTAGRQG